MQKSTVIPIKLDLIEHIGKKLGNYIWFLFALYLCLWVFIYGYFIEILPIAILSMIMILVPAIYIIIKYPKYFICKPSKSTLLLISMKLSFGLILIVLVLFGR